MDHLDLCSGIGGFAIAARWMGWKTVGFAEIDEFASKVLEKHWPGVPNYGDIRSVPDGTRADILTAGFPCQPYSCAGKQLGEKDDRAIWPLVIEVVKRVQPRWCVFENVAGIINMALDGVLSDLEAEGYEVGTVVVPACAVNAPHRRDRVWIVAFSDRQLRQSGEGERPGVRDKAGIERPDVIAGRASHKSEALADTSSEGSLSAAHTGIHRGEESAGSRHAQPERRGEALSDASRELRYGSGQARQERRSEHPDGGEDAPDADRKPLGRATEPRGQRGGGQPEPGLGGNFDGLSAGMDGPVGSGPDYWDGDWERGVPRVSTGVKDRAKRLKALGNAIVPQVAYQIFRSVAEADRGRS